MAGDTGFHGTLDKASHWFTSLGHRTRTTMTPPATLSSGMRVFQPRNTTSIVISKGLTNAPGENNCFLNSAVQVLWHLDVFRRSFRDMAGHACMGKACIFCALKVLFTQLQYGEEKALPPDALRKALASAFKDEQRFQLGCMDDAAECFENILVRIHFHLAHDIKEDLCDAKHCVSHQKFAMTLIEHCVCPCGATSEPFPFTQMVHYVSCTALCGEAKNKRAKNQMSSAFFGLLLRNAGAIGDVRQCPSECGKKVFIRRVLMNCPDVVGIGLVWDSDRPSVDHIMDVISCLGTTLRLPDLFNSVVDEQAKKIALNLVGVVTYYGKHYSTFFYNTKRRLWIYFDDASVKQVGPTWRDVAERCRRGHFQPLLLLYANPNGKAVDITTAPKETAILPGYQNLDSPDKPHARMPSYSSRPHHIRSGTKPKATSHSGGTLESTGAIYKSVSPVPEFSASSRPTSSLRSTQGHKHSGLDSVVEIGHDALGGLSLKDNSSTSIDGSRTFHSSSSVRRSQQEALKLAGFACTQEYETTSHPPTSHSGFIESSGMPQPLLSGNYNQMNSQRTDLSTKMSEPSDLIGQYDVDSWTRSSGNTSSQAGVVPLRLLKCPQGIRRGTENRRMAAVHPICKTNQLQGYLDESQSRQLVRHQSWSGRTANSKSIPIYENVVDGAIANDTTDSAEGNVPLQSRHSRYGSTPDLQQGISQTSSNNVSKEGQSRHSDSTQQSKPELQNQLGNTKKSSSLSKAAADNDIYASMPDLQRSLSNPPATTRNIAAQGILADAIKNDQEHRKMTRKVASRSSSSSLTSSPDSKRSSQASQASTFTTDSTDTSQSEGSSRSGSLRSKYGVVASGFVTLPRKKHIRDFADGKNIPQSRSAPQRSHNRHDMMQRSQSDPPPPSPIGPPPALQQQNSAPAQFAGVFIDDDDATSRIPDATTEPHQRTRRPSHLQHFTTETPTRKDPLEEGSVGSKDSGYRSRDRSSASSGSVYSVDSPGTDEGGLADILSGKAIPTSPDTTRKKEVEALCVAVTIDVEEMLDKCHQQEAEGDLAMALALCTSAVTKLKSTLQLNGISDSTRHFLQTKYSTSVVKSRSLHRRLQIVRSGKRMDSLDDSVNDRHNPEQPSSPIQPIRPASTQPSLFRSTSSSSSSSMIGVRSQHPSTDLTSGVSHGLNTRVNHPGFVPNGHTQARGGTQGVYNPQHATDPRTGLFRPHSAQLPRKQYDFNTQQQQHARQGSIGYGADRYRRSSESGQEMVADSASMWRPGAANTSRNPPRRSAVEASTTVTPTIRQFQEAPMSDPLLSDKHGVDRLKSTKEPLDGNFPIKQSADSCPIQVIHSKPTSIHSKQFTESPASPEVSNSQHCDDVKSSSATILANVKHVNKDGKEAGKKNLDELCTAALEDFQRSSTRKKMASNTGTVVTYVIKLQGTMKSIPEAAK
ncbi:LOW QUALITY PROTEIN: uncharacterized protein [Amphiura filiformis]|uniref:LOW QUALITY PROTEIN: uncharacterized protein n=1 Tax=Amphiura filiformis TaxID=82378 RepID=UPI003B216FDF